MKIFYKMNSGQILSIIIIVIPLLMLIYCGSDDKDNISNDSNKKEIDKSSENDNNTDNNNISESSDASTNTEDKSNKSGSADSISSDDNSNNKSNNNTDDFYNKAEKMYDIMYEYLNSFSESEAPSGKELLSKTIKLTSFLNDEGSKNKEVIKTKTYKSFFKLFKIFDILAEKNKKVLTDNQDISTEDYIDYFNKKLKDINNIFEEIKEGIESRN